VDEHNQRQGLSISSAALWKKEIQFLAGIVVPDVVDVGSYFDCRLKLRLRLCQVTGAIAFRLVFLRGGRKGKDCEEYKEGRFGHGE